MSALDLVPFLQHVLPPTGKYIYAWKSSAKGMQQRVVGSVEDLAANVRALSQDGFDTYFACSTFTGQPTTVVIKGKETKRFRTKEQAAGTKAFWIDIDVGEDKPYATVEEAERDFYAWIDDWGLPEPTVVYSGGGLHIYWALTRVLQRDAWEAIAFRLKAFCDQTELPIDRTRTGDISSVLRPPDTLNFKRGPAGQLVLLSSLQPPIDPDRLAELLPQVQAPTRQAVTLAARPHDKFSAIYAEVPAFAAKMGAECQWLNAVGVTARGNVYEPMWYAMLGVLIFAQDGEHFAHAWSNGHEGYDPEEVEHKMDQARGVQSGPTTCAKLESEWAEGCIGCPHRGKITSPLQLGRPSQVADPRAALAEIIKPQAAPVAGAVDEVDIAALLEWPYYWDVDGALRQTVYSVDVPFTDQLYAYPFFIETMRKAELSGAAHALLRHWAPHDGWLEANIPAGDLTADGAFRMLGNQHIEIDPPHYKAFTLFMSKAKQDYRDNRRTELQHETFGWKEEGFLVGETLIVGNITARAGLSTELKRFSAKLTSHGDLKLWCDAAQQLFLPGYEHEAMAVLAGFGAPLMRFAPYPGTVYSIVSEQSGRGKTFSVEAANSIWGEDRALWISHRDDKAAAGDTVKAQYRAMVLLKNLPIIADELRETDPEKLRGFITGFTDGSPPRGLTRDGIFRNTSGIWQTILLATSNKSITDIVTINNDPAAANRVFEVQATLPANADGNNANRIRKTMLANCGLSGIAFIQALMEPETFAWAEVEVRTLVDQYTSTLAATREDKNGGDRFIASFFACCMVAGKLLNKIGLLQVDLERMLSWAIERWGMQRAQIEQSHRNAAEGISAFIREYIQNIIAVRTSDGVALTRPLARAPLVGRIDSGTGKLFLDRNVVQRWATKENLHYLGMCEELSAQGILLDRNARRNLGHGTDYAGTGQTAVWIIDSDHPALSGELREISASPPTKAEPVPLRPVPTTGVTKSKKGP